MAKESTALWYLVPIIFGILGGIVGWVALKGSEPKKAKTLLYIGIGRFILGLIIYAATFAFALFSSIF